MENTKKEFTIEDFVGWWLGLLLVFILPICFGIALGWRIGLLVMPFSHGAYIYLKFVEINNGRNNNKES